MGCKSDFLPSWEAALRQLPGGQGCQDRQSHRATAKDRGSTGCSQPRQACRWICRNKSLLMRARDTADTNKRARRMCPLLQVLWLVHWDFALCRKLLVCPNFHISAEANWGVMLSLMDGERAPRAEVCTGGQCPSTQMFPRAFLGVWSPRRRGCCCCHLVRRGNRGSSGCKDAAPSPVLSCSGLCPQRNRIKH